MDDEETVWRLDVTSVSGFAIQNPTATSPQHDIPIYYSLQEYDIQVSQTLESHSFPFHLRVYLAHRASGQVEEGILLLVPLEQIVNIAISDHGPQGQSLRFKLIPGHQRMMGVIRQSITSGRPGKMWGVNEDDRYHLHGMLRFREFVVRNAGVDEQQISAMGSWVECLKRHAQKEFSHEIQVLKEGPDGVWRNLDDDDGDREDPYRLEGIKQDSPDEKVETLDEETEESFAIATIDITDCSVNGEFIEPEKTSHFSTENDVQLKAGPNTRRDLFGDTIEDAARLIRHDLSAQESQGIQSAYLTPCQSPGSEHNGPQISSSNTSPEASSAPYDATPPCGPSKYPQNSPQQNARQQSTSRAFELTGPNAIECTHQSVSSFPPSNQTSPAMKHTSPIDFRHSPSHHRSPDGIPVGPEYRNSQHYRKDNKFRRFQPRYRPSFNPRFPNHHVNNISMPKQQYDSYRPYPQRSATLDRRIEPFPERTLNNGRKRRKVRVDRRS